MLSGKVRSLQKLLNDLSLKISSSTTLEGSLRLAREAESLAP